MPAAAYSFYQDKTGVSTLQSIVTNLQATLVTGLTTPWVLESAFFPLLPGDPNSFPFPGTAAPVESSVGGTHYCTLIYKIGDFGTVVGVGSPWRVKLKFLNTVAVNSIKIDVTTGSGFTGVANGSTGDITNPGVTCTYDWNATATPKTCSEWFITAYESGFSIIFMPSLNTDNGFITVERARSLTAVLNKSIITMMSADGTAITAGASSGFTPLITNNNAYSKLVACRARRWITSIPDSDQSPAEALILRSTNPSLGTQTMLSTAVLHDPTGAATPAGVTLGLFPVSGGVHGTPRTIVMTAFQDYVPGNPVTITQDAASRSMRVPSSFSSTSYYVCCPLET